MHNEMTQKERYINYIPDKQAYRIEIVWTKKGNRTRVVKLLPKTTTLEEAKLIRDRMVSEAVMERFGLSESSNWDSLVDASVSWKDSWGSVIYKSLQLRAKTKGYQYMSKEEFVELLKDSGGKCAITGVAFSMSRINGVKKRPLMPSIDRIDAKKGYQKENCRVVCTAVNLAMMDWGEGLFKSLAIGYIKNQILDKAFDDVIAKASPITATLQTNATTTPQN